MGELENNAVSLALKRLEEILYEIEDRGADLLEEYFPTKNRK